MLCKMFVVHYALTLCFIVFTGASETLCQVCLLHCFQSTSVSRLCVTHGNHVLLGFSISDSYCCILFSNISLDYSQDFILLLFSEKHCDYFNRSEPLLSSLKVSAAMLLSVRLSLKGEDQVRQDELKGLSILNITFYVKYMRQTGCPTMYPCHAQLERKQQWLHCYTYICKPKMFIWCRRC